MPLHGAMGMHRAVEGLVAAGLKAALLGDLTIASHVVRRHCLLQGAWLTARHAAIAL